MQMKCKCNANEMKCDQMPNKCIILGTIQYLVFVVCMTVLCVPVPTHPPTIWVVILFFGSGRNGVCIEQKERRHGGGNTGKSKSQKEEER